ncbi:unnamed protein product [Mycena citricolor]|uniref:Alcohol acetyltransferase n=1 Tax=Mycena citricolor TaxID=2018698 RepID=A0AAD2JYN4_9AGAR|nr:unnamed protein product [Mycena citricolor]
MSLLRNAGLLECFHISRALFGLDSCVVVSARYVHESGSQLKLTREILFPALGATVRAHPILSARVKDEDSKQPYFVRLDSVDLASVVRFLDTADLEVAIQAQLSAPFDTSAELPLWRVTVLSDNTVLFAYHHGIGDGLSGVAFHHSLYAALQAPDLSPTEVVVPDDLPVVPAIDVALDVRPSLLTIIRTVISLFIPDSWRTAYTAWTANPVPADPELSPRVKIFVLPPSEMAGFSKVCRANCATVTSAFYILAVAILSRHIPPESTYKTIGAAVAMSLRGLTDTPAGAICDYATGQSTFPPVDPAFKWSRAAEYAKDLQAARVSGKERIGLLALLRGDLQPYFRAQLGKKRTAAFELSNTGRVKFEGQGTWQVADVTFAQCDLIYGAALKVNVVGDPTGAVRIALTWNEDAIDEGLVETFAREFQDGVRALLP